MTKQHTMSDCAIAAIANVTGVSYHAVKKRYGRCDDGLTQDDITALLGEQWRLVRPRRPRTLAEFLAANIVGRFVVVTRSRMPWVDADHAVAVIDGEIIGTHRLTNGVAYYYVEGR